MSALIRQYQSVHPFWLSCAAAQNTRIHRPRYTCIKYVEMGRIYLRRGVVVSGVRRMNEVNARRARLVPGWVTVFGRVYYLGM